MGSARFLAFLPVVLAVGISALGCGGSGSSKRADETGVRTWVEQLDSVPVSTEVAEVESTPEWQDDAGWSSGSRGPVDDRKGLQLVFLHRYKTTSMTNLKKALMDSPTNVEIAFEPFLDDSGDDKATTARGSFANAKALVNTLAGNGRLPVFTVQFGFHSGSSKSNRDAPKDDVLRYRAASFYKNLYKANRKKAEFVLCPSLEDEWSSQGEWSRAGKVMLEGFLSAAAADKLTAADIVNVSVRRSSNAHGDDYPATLTGEAKIVVKKKTQVAFTTDLAVGGELHGKVTGKEVAYSNDGQVVYASKHDEDGQSMPNADEPKYSGQYDLQDWLDALATIRAKKTEDMKKFTPVLLWRPGYNCFARETEKLGNKDVLTKPIRYIAADRSHRFDEQLDDKGRRTGKALKSGPVFDSTEVKVAQAFFKG